MQLRDQGYYSTYTDGNMDSQSLRESQKFSMLSNVCGAQKGSVISDINNATPINPNSLG